MQPGLPIFSSTPHKKGSSLQIPTTAFRKTRFSVRELGEKDTRVNQGQELERPSLSFNVPYYLYEQSLAPNLIRKQHCDLCGSYNHMLELCTSGQSLCSVCQSVKSDRKDTPTNTSSSARFSNAGLQHERLCNYIFCSEPLSHITSVCPHLILRCPSCGCRGHNPNLANCKQNSPFYFEFLYEMFEKSADKHVYASHRWCYPAIGFFAFEYPEDQFNGPSYEMLSEMPVMKSLSITAPKMFCRS